MYIDGRDLSIEEVLTRMRDIARAQCGAEVDLQVHVDSKDDAAKIKGFASMTGCDVKIQRKDDGYLMNISGGSCKCG